MADKLTQLTILLCLALRYPIFWAMLLVLLVKELLMLIGGLVLLKKHIHPGSAKWFGKLATCFFYISMAFIVLWPKLPPHMVNTIILINILLFAFALMMYIPVFFTLKRGD